MKAIAYAIAIAAFTTLGLSTAAEARERSRSDDAFRKGSVIDRTGKPRRFDNHVDRRQEVQRPRARKGRQDGKLKRKEVARLRHDHKRIHRVDRRFGGDDHYSPRERRRLDGHRIKRSWHKHHHRSHRYDHRGHDYKGHWRKPKHRHHHKRSSHADHHVHRAPYAYGPASGYSQDIVFGIDGMILRWHEWGRD